MTNTTICATPQHTGTWFLIDVLERLLYVPRTLTEDVVADLNTLTKPKMLLHYHVDNIPYSSRIITDYVKSATALQPIQFERIYQSDLHSNHFKTVIAIRDPLLSLITRQGWYPKHVQRPRALIHNHVSIVNGFYEISRVYQNSNVFLFPIDLYTEKHDRLMLLQQLEQFLNLNPNPAVCHDIATQWRPVHPTKTHNTFGEAPEKQLYKDGQLDKVIKTLDIECDVLFKTPNIKTMLQSTGYDTLPWFERVQ